MFLNPNIFANLNSNCPNLLDLRNLQEQVKKAFCYQKLFWPFAVWINCSSDLKKLSNSQRTIFSQWVGIILVTKYHCYFLFLQLQNSRKKVGAMTTIKRLDRYFMANILPFSYKSCFLKNLATFQEIVKKILQEMQM